MGGSDLMRRRSVSSAHAPELPPPRVKLALRGQRGLGAAHQLFRAVAMAVAHFMPPGSEATRA
eukprot:3712532-Prymnesium_polylepis.1